MADTIEKIIKDIEKAKANELTTPTDYLILEILERLAREIARISAPALPVTKVTKLSSRE